MPDTPTRAEIEAALKVCEEATPNWRESINHKAGGDCSLLSNDAEALATFTREQDAIFFLLASTLLPKALRALLERRSPRHPHH